MTDGFRLGGLSVDDVRKGGKVQIVDIPVCSHGAWIDGLFKLSCMIV